MPLDPVTARLAVWQKGSSSRRIICGAGSCGARLGDAVGILPIEGWTVEQTAAFARLADADPSLDGARPWESDTTYVWYAHYSLGYHRNKGIWVPNKPSKVRYDNDNWRPYQSGGDEAPWGFAGRRSVKKSVIEAHHLEQIMEITGGHGLIGNQPRLPCRILCEKCQGGRVNYVFVPPPAVLPHG